jgi:hypothetical protein
LATETTEDQRFVSEYLAQAVAAGMDPDGVARCVIDGIRAEQFLILTHAAYPEKLLDRAAALADRRLPDLPHFD